MTLNDPDLVRREYADETRFAVRADVWHGATGVDPWQIVLGAIEEIHPRRVLEVGCGRGELAERILADIGADVVAIDQSERMVELTRARGVNATVGDVQSLELEDGSFDAAVAAWMLYHVPDLDKGLSELLRVLRPGGRLVAVTNSQDNLPELWGLFGERRFRLHGFNAENGEEILTRHFARVERRDAPGTITFEDWEAAHRYVASSPSRSHLAADLPMFAAPLRCSRLAVVFVAERP